VKYVFSKLKHVIHEFLEAKRSGGISLINKMKKCKMELPDGEYVISEIAINKWLETEFTKSSPGRLQSRRGFWQMVFPQRVIRFLSVKFEDHNVVKIAVMSRFVVQVHLDGCLLDAWHDNKTSTIVLGVDSISLLEMALLPNFISRRLSYLFLSLLGFVLNPITLNSGIALRCDGEKIRIDLHDYLYSCDYPPISAFLKADDCDICNFFITGIKTSKGLVKIETHSLSDAVRKYCPVVTTQGIIKRSPEKWISGQDILGFALIAVGAFLIVGLIHPIFHVSHIQVAFSWYFVASLFIAALGLLIPNLPRWLYQFKVRQKGLTMRYAGEHIQYRLERRKRDIELYMRDIQNSKKESLEALLLKMSKHRSIALLLEERQEKINRRRKLKYGLAYIITVLSEAIAYHYFKG
jgi:hypothetical protein